MTAGAQDFLGFPDPPPRPAPGATSAPAPAPAPVLAPPAAQPAPERADAPDLEALRAASIHRIKGPTILLGSGSYFDFEAPDAAELTIEDIAYGLAYACRFAGQCVQRSTGRRVFYSVAQHCVEMSRRGPPELAFDLLMHEAGEATCGDMTGPLKSLCPDYKAVEKRCEAAALARFGVSMADPAAVKLWDLRMLATERRDLLPWKGEEWAVTGGAEPLPEPIEPWAPDVAAVEFLIRYYLLAPPASAPVYHIVDLRSRNLSEDYITLWRDAERGYAVVLDDAGRFSADHVHAYFGPHGPSNWMHFPVRTEIAAALSVPNCDLGFPGTANGPAIPNTMANRKRLIEAARFAARQGARHAG